MRYDPNEADDDFDRDFYLGEEGQTIGIEGHDESRLVGGRGTFVNGKGKWSVYVILLYW